MGAASNAAGRSLPRFIQLRAKLAERIVAGEWLPGQILPTQRKLAAAYGVSINTVCRALAPFVEVGLLRQKQGAGTFIRRMPPPEFDALVTLASTQSASTWNAEAPIWHSHLPDSRPEERSQE